MRTANAALLLMLTACNQDPSPPADPPEARATPPRIQTPAPAGPRLLSPADPAGSVLDIAALQGRWRVDGVAIADGPVQAYGPDDPAYMGQSITIAGTRLAWDKPAAPTGATIDDVCTGAATMRLTGDAAAAAAEGLATALARLGVARPDPHEVACLDGGNWGGGDGGAVLFPIDARTMAMRWYDNVVLRLRWQPPA